MSDNRPAHPAGLTPPGWPTPTRMAVIMDAIRRRVEEYRAEFDAGEPEKGENGNKLRDFPL